MMNVSELAARTEAVFNHHFCNDQMTRPAITGSPDGGRVLSRVMRKFVSVTEEVGLAQAEQACGMFRGSEGMLAPGFGPLEYLCEQLLT